MRWTQTLIPTLRETPRDAEAMSHILMLRAGLVRKLSSGVYSYLPLGLRVLEKVSRLIREEMNRADAVEVLLPTLHPAEIWRKTGRFEALAEDKFSFKNRSGQEYVLGPTHEEVVTELVASYARSYKDLPKILFQIQTKFRDELRPRFGVIRSKEFMMKDAYSFDVDLGGLDQSYRKMYEAYERIFQRTGLTYDIVSADPGLMGGKVSHEFMVKCSFGEDLIASCRQCSYTASRDIAERRSSSSASSSRPSSNKIESFDTPHLKTITEIVQNFKVSPEKLVKTLLYIGDGKPLAACVRGDSEVNEGKLKRLSRVEHLIQAQVSDIEKYTGAPLGFTGPVGLEGVRIFCDYDLVEMSDFVTGANQKDKHFRNVNMGRDFKPDLVGDIRYVQEGDLCAQKQLGKNSECTGKLKLETAMEVGHVFKLGTRYSEPLDAHYLDEAGKKQWILMGCYGIGVNRIMAAHIEEHHDEKGIVWQKALAPYEVLLLTVNHEDGTTRQEADEIYRVLHEAGVEVLYDDRVERAGVKFNDADLIGIPLQVVVGERHLKQGKVELLIRAGKKSSLVEKSRLLEGVQEILKSLS